MLMLKDALRQEGLVVHEWYDPARNAKVVTVRDTFDQEIAREEFTRSISPSETLWVEHMRITAVGVEINHWLWSVLKQVNPSILSN